MPIQYPTEKRLQGPWFLTSDALIELDQVVDKEIAQLESRRQSLINQYAETRYEEYKQKGLFSRKQTSKERTKEIDELKADPPYKLKAYDRSLDLFIKNGGKYRTEKFSTALNDNSLHQETIEEFSMNIESAEVRCSLYSEDRNIKIRVSPEDLPDANELYSTLLRWANNYSAPTWQQIWIKYQSVFFAAWFFLLIILFYYFAITLNSSTSFAKDRARLLLDQGITEQNTREAIELILIIQSDYDPESDSQNLNIPTWFAVYFWGGVLANIILSFKPPTILGIGKGDKKIRAWKAWIAIFGLTIPSLLFTSIVWPRVSEFINKLLK